MENTKPPHKGSYRATRTGHFRNMPSFTEIIKLVKAIPDLTAEEKAYFALAITTGSRVSEIINIKKGDITFKGNRDIPLSADAIHMSYITKVDFSILRLKGRKKGGKPEYRYASVPRSSLFDDLIEWIINRYKQLPTPESKMYTKSRMCAHWLVKRLGRDYYNHYFRHLYITNLARAGVPVAIIKAAVGWRSLDSWNSYAHLSDRDLDDQLKKAFGEDIPAGDPNKPISQDQALGALAAATQVDEKIITTEKNQKKKVAILEIDGQRKEVVLPRGARVIRNKLLQVSKNIKVAPVILTVSQEDANLMVV